MAQGSGMSGLSEDEARGFHGVFMMSFGLFVVVAAIAHRCHAQMFDELEHGRACLFADRVTEDTSEVTNVLAEGKICVAFSFHFKQPPS